ncbi:MAG: thioredoxin domain-containing protein [Spirochaetales bacterium]|nr:MAG: thioredoxin domain-containing protein [Spirochaetales bacterium]
MDIRIPSFLLAVLLSSGCALTKSNEVLPQPQSGGYRLAAENSPYLLQHADNPVDWYPWGEEALLKARKEDKLIFLSIGYSSCHWCHVMEEESFKDDEVAAILNRHFVSVKVDKEERPDLDSFYMDVAFIVNGSGGWPLNIILTPEGKPFFAAAYMPKESTKFSSGFTDILTRAAELWQADREKVNAAAAAILENLGKAYAGKDSGAILPPPEQAEMLKPLLERTFGEFVRTFDPENGGFGGSPKFPKPQNIIFLLRYGAGAREPEALAMAEKTLVSLRAGGIFDQLGFGFHRYATDRQWRTPHFEKTLYDQAYLSIAYLEAYLALDNSSFADTARDTALFVLRELSSPDGGFYSARDADSEGEEGKFYAWEFDEFRNNLEPGEFPLLDYFNLTPEGNLTDPVTGQLTGKNVLFYLPGQKPPLPEPAFERARLRLMAVRDGRVNPAVDDKVLTNWNGLMIYALARGAWVLNRPDFLAAAKRAADFFSSELKKNGGTLYHSYRNGTASVPANLEDYAFLAAGFLELYRAEFDPAWIEAAGSLVRDAARLLEDPAGGAFYFSGASIPGMAVRKKEAADNAYPSGNAMMAETLFRLFHLTGDVSYRDKGERILAAFAEELTAYPQVFPSLLETAYSYGPGSRQIVVAGEERETEQFIRLLNRTYLPGSVVLLKDGRRTEQLEHAAPFTAGYTGVPGAPAAVYLCKDFSCKTPVTDVTALQELLYREGSAQTR